MATTDDREILNTEQPNPTIVRELEDKYGPSLGYDPELDHEETPEWEIQPGEPTQWFSRFQYYLRQGPRRTIARTYRHYISGDDTPSFIPRLSKDWQTATQKWEWGKRAAAYDSWRLKVEREELEDLRKKARTARISLLLEYNDKVRVGLDDLDVKELSWRDAPNAVAVAVRELRIELGDDPSNNTKETKQVATEQVEDAELENAEITLAKRLAEQLQREDAKRSRDPKDDSGSEDRQEESPSNAI